MTKKTSRELIGELIDVNVEIAWATDDEHHDQLHQERERIEKEISRKIDGIDWYITEIQKRLGEIDGAKKALRDEISRLMKRQKAVQKTKDYLEKDLLPQIIKVAGKDGTFETATAKYTLYEGWGGLKILDEEKIPNEYRRMEEKIDSGQMRKDIMAGKEIEGATVEKQERIRRS